MTITAAVELVEDSEPESHCAAVDDEGSSESCSKACIAAGCQGSNRYRKRASALTSTSVSYQRRAEASSQPTRRRPVARLIADSAGLAGCSDAQLVLMIARGSQVAWNELVSRHARLVWQVAKRNGLSDSDAADASQLTWLRLMGSIASIRDPSRLPGWLATTARRESIRIATRARREIPLAENVSQQEELDPTSFVDSRLLKESLNDEVGSALEGLPGRYRELLRLLMSNEGLSYAEIAERLHLPVGSIGPMRGRALLLVRRRLPSLA